jgi:hypothetical protein
MFLPCGFLAMREAATRGGITLPMLQFGRKRLMVCGAQPATPSQAWAGRQDYWWQPAKTFAETCFGAFVHV